MSLNYTKLPFFNLFSNGATFPLLFVVFLPFLIQEGGCEREYDKPPSCGYMLSPAAGTNNIGESVTISWAKVPGASSYKLHVRTKDSDAYLLNQDIGANNSYTVNGLPKGTQIFVTITPTNKHGDAVGCEDAFFTTAAPPTVAPNCTNITAPANGANDVALFPTISWSPASGTISGYIFNATSADGSLSETFEFGKNVTSYDGLKLSYEQSVTVTITPFNEAGRASGCSSISFKTKKEPVTPPPACVTLRSPVNGTSDVAINSEISWNASASQVEGYRVSIGTTSGGSEILSRTFGKDETSYTPTSPLPPGTTIFVSVIPFNEKVAEGCVVSQFSTAASNIPDPGDDDDGGDDDNNVGGEEPKYVRREVSAMDFNDPVLVTYRDAVTKMKALPDDHPHSWAAQAKIHQQHCPHGGWTFLPWHRAYLYYFEEAIRAVSGDDSFALPYWDWTKSPSVPAAFWGNDNALFNQRNVNPNSRADDGTIGADEIDDLLSIEDFGAFASSKTRSGALESSPHNYIHGWVGGQMGFIHTAGQDPLFWCHHANVDRLWAMWNEFGNANINEDEWLDIDFNDNFHDKDGNPVKTTVRDWISTYEKDFRYESQSRTRPNTAFQSLPVNYTAIEGMTFLQTDFGKKSIGSTYKVDMKPNTEFLNRVNDLLEAPPGDIPEAVFFFIDSIAPPMEGNIFIKIFANHDNPTLSTSTRDVHFVESFGFFRMGMQGDGSHSGDHQHTDMGSYIFDITPTLRAIREETGVPIDKIEIQLVVNPFSDQSSGWMFTPGKFMIQLAEKS